MVSALFHGWMPRYTLARAQGEGRQQNISLMGDRKKGLDGLGHDIHKTLLCVDSPTNGSPEAYVYAGHILLAKPYISIGVYGVQTFSILPALHASLQQQQQQQPRKFSVPRERGAAYTDRMYVQIMPAGLQAAQAPPGRSRMTDHRFVSASPPSQPQCGLDGWMDWTAGQVGNSSVL